MKKGGYLGHIFMVGAFTMLSRVLGLAREMLQSRQIGAGVAQSAFALAFALPNMARKIFGEGALTAAFVPVFRGEVEEVGLEKASRLARIVMTMVLLLLATIVLVALAGLVATLFLADRLALADRTRITVSLVAILIPYMLAICGAAFGMGVLNAMNRYKAASFMPSILNLVWIAALIAIAFFPELAVVTRVRIVAGAILFGGFVQFAFMLRCMARAGVSPRLCFSGWRGEKVRLVWRNLAIAAAGAGAIQLNYLLDQVLAQCAAEWAAGVISFAERLMDLPLGVIGVAFGTVLLPTFSRSFAKGNVAGAREVLATSVRNMMFVMIPAAAGLCVLSTEVTRVVYQGGEFGDTDTIRVARAVAVYAVGLGFFGLQKTLVPWFQAQKDMKTPFGVTTVTVAANATLNILAVWLLPVEWRHVGLAASTVFCACLGCMLLLVQAYRRNGCLGLSGTVPYLLRVLVAALIMAAAVAFVRREIALKPLPTLIVTVMTGAVVYAFLAVLLKIWRFPRRTARAGA